ncbi:hypothetical protein FA13DRAFT_1732121 [Coprinellus micaceus]|uniref:Uncharacterized protein n=1 Tax=Coprinellus micaceus TaxID=71717 RepID=A0A4Y7TCC4_COPMI|nr:hypothetical protein FA13DRAFT_1732121 [Coprinellus micaceus]
MPALLLPSSFPPSFSTFFSLYSPFLPSLIAIPSSLPAETVHSVRFNVGEYCNSNPGLFILPVLAFSSP